VQSRLSRTHRRNAQNKVKIVSRAVAEYCFRLLAMHRLRRALLHQSRVIQLLSNVFHFIGNEYIRNLRRRLQQNDKPGIERVQAHADISRSALCCPSNETRAPIAYMPNSAQLGRTPYHSPSYIRIRAVVWECGEGQTDRHTDTQTAVTNIHFASAIRFTRNVNTVNGDTNRSNVCNLQYNAACKLRPNLIKKSQSYFLLRIILRSGSII